MGLSQLEAEKRLQAGGRNELIQRRRLSQLMVLYGQVKSPLVLLLLFASVVSAATGEWIDAGLVLSIVMASVVIGARREYKGQAAAAALAARIHTRATVLRDGAPQRLPVEELVPGDVVLLAAGSLVPADAVVIEARDCHLSEAELTGESFSVEKEPGVLSPTYRSPAAPTPSSSAATCAVEPPARSSKRWTWRGRRRTSCSWIAIWKCYAAASRQADALSPIR